MNLKKVAKIITIFAALAGLYHIIVVFLPLVPTLIHRATHLAIALTLIFLLKPIKRGLEKKKVYIIDFILIGSTWWIYYYICSNYQYLTTRLSYVAKVSTYQAVLGLALVLLVFEGCRRTTGMILPSIATLFMFYALFGAYLPIGLRHKGFTFNRVMECLFLTTDSIFGDPLNVSATYIILFMLFGSFLDRSGIGDAFIELARKTVGWARGGPGKVAVVSSALFGTVSGSAVGNVAVTGSFTIPMMKKSGFAPHFAGAVEAAASAGGQIMPPVMGAAAFIMAEFIGIPYIQIIKHALIPALLYFYGVFIMIDLYAAKKNIKGEGKFSLKSLTIFLHKKGYLFSPLIVLIILLAKGFTPVFSATVSMILCIFLSWFNPGKAMGFKDIILSLEEGVMMTANLAMTCCCAGMVIGLISLSGIAVKFSMLIMSLSSSTSIVLIIVALTGLFLGMGLPTTPAYIIQAGLIVPSLIRFGLLPIQAHLFVMYFAVISVVTPPVCLAAYTAAGIANSDMNKTGWTSFLLALTGLVVPFYFATNPSILMYGSLPQILWSTFTMCLCIYFGSMAINRFYKTRLNMLETILCSVSAVAMFPNNYTVNIIGLCCFAVVAAFQWIETKRQDVSI